MAAAKSIDLYERVMELVDSGLNDCAIARLVPVSRRTICSWRSGKTRPNGTAFDRQRLTGDKALRWLGSDAKPESVKVRGRKVARKLFAVPERCERCNCKLEKRRGGYARHHVDGDTTNNSRSNLQFLCQSCHMKVDNPKHKKGRGRNSPRKV